MAQVTKTRAVIIMSKVNIKKKRAPNMKGVVWPSKLARPLTLFFLGKIEELVDRAVSEKLPSVVEEEFNKRFLKEPETTPVRIEPLRTAKSAILAPKSKEDYDYKNFTICNPPTFDGTPNPIVSARWLSEIEGVFRVSRCPIDYRIIYGTSMLRNTEKRWWDGLFISRGEERILSMTWDEFKTLFLDEFAPEAEVVGLREEFLTTKQGNRTVNEFHAWVVCNSVLSTLRVIRC